MFSPSFSTEFASRLSSKNLKIKIYKTIILPVVLYWCETWSLTLREESRLRVSDSWILKRIFGVKRDENRVWILLLIELIRLGVVISGKQLRIINASLNFQVS